MNFKKGDKVRRRRPTPVPWWRGVVKRVAKDGSWADVTWTSYSVKNFTDVHVGTHRVPQKDLEPA